MSHYRAGADFERAVRADLVANGYEVIRSAGSKTKVDLIAFKYREVLFVQCKRDGKISPGDRYELRRLASLVAAVPIIAWKTLGASAIRYSFVTDLDTRVDWTPDLATEDQ